MIKKMNLLYSDIMKTSKDIGGHIRKIREAKGIDAQDVAQAIGVLKSTYSTMELGDRKIRAEEIPPIAKALGVSIADLFEEEPERIVQGLQFTRQNNPMKLEALQGLVNQLRSLPPEVQDQLATALFQLFRSEQSATVPQTSASPSSTDQ